MIVLLWLQSHGFVVLKIWTWLAIQCDKFPWGLVNRGAGWIFSLSARNDLEWNWITSTDLSWNMKIVFHFCDSKFLQIQWLQLILLKHSKFECFDASSSILCFPSIVVFNLSGMSPAGGLHYMVFLSNRYAPCFFMLRAPFCLLFWVGRKITSNLLIVSFHLQFLDYHTCIHL